MSMQTVEQHGLTILQSGLLLDQGVPHGWFDRSLGNVQYRPGNPYNDPESLTEERQLARYAQACGAIGLDVYRLVRTNGLVQTDIVQHVGEEHAGAVTGKADGYITNTRMLPVAINAADCLQTVLYDPRSKALALVHSGGKGTATGILPKTLRMMTEMYETKPADVIVGIGPAISGKYFAPSRDVDGFEITDSGYEEVIRTNRREQSPGYDVGSTAIFQLLKAGVILRHLDVSDLDTYEDESRFFSWERDRLTDPAESMRRQPLIAAVPAA